MTLEAYEKYKDSQLGWIGKIPEHWQVSKVKFHFIRKNNKSNEENPIVLSLARSGVKIRDIESGEGQLAESYYGYNPVKPGDLLLNPMDLISGANCSLSEVEGVISPAYVNLVSLENINPKYYDYFFKTQYWSMAFFVHGKGVSTENRWTLTNETIMNYFIPVPDYETQKRISAFLDDNTFQIGQLIEKNLKLIELLKEKRTSLINQVVTKGLDPDAPMKDSGIDWIGEIPKHWDVNKLKNISQLFGRIGFRGYTVTDLVNEGEGALTIGGKHIQNNKLDLSNPEYLSWKKYYESPEIMIEVNDLIISQRGTLGKVALVENDLGPATINPSMILIKKVLINNKYLYYYLSSNFINETINFVNSQTAVPMISQEQANNFQIIIPILKDQEEIVDYLDNETFKIDQTIEKIQKENELLEEYKQSLIYHVVTGKVKIEGE